MWHFTNKSVTGAPYSIKSCSYNLSHSWTLWSRVQWLKQCRLQFSPELSANVVHGEVKLCASTSLRRTRDERRRWRQTAAVVTVAWKYSRDLSCSNLPLSPQVHALLSTRWYMSVNDAHCVFDRVLQNTLWRLQWHEHSWWQLRQCRPPGLEQFIPAAQMCHQHEQDQSGSNADVERMNTTAPQSWEG